MKKATIILTIISLLIGASFPTYAAYLKTQKSEDQVVIEIVFSDTAEAELFKAAMIDTQQGLTNSFKELAFGTGDADKKSYILNKAKQVESIDIGSLFTVNKDGVNVYTIPYPSAEIEVGYQVLFADENGMLSFDKSFKDKDAIIAHKGYAIESGKLNIEESPDGSYIIKVTRTLSELAEGMLQMGESMAMEGQANIYRSFMSEGTTWAPGTGAGVSKIIYSTSAKKNIVGCNKLHKSYTENISPAALLAGGSDCGISIRLGMLPIGYTWSDYCLDESLNGGDETSAGRRFCTNDKSLYTTDGVYKEGHYNCSWFPGVNCSEEGHTHS
jgi:hypothetical protein